LLRFYGHGNRGTWFTIAVGDPVHAESNRTLHQAMVADWHGYIDLNHVNRLAPTLRRLNPYFARFASVEHHGCNLGRAGSLLQHLANIWHVPVTATRRQHLCMTVEYLENPTFTAYPRGRSLYSWARSVAESTACARPALAVPVGHR
jgi:hypothetical protein